MKTLLYFAIFSTMTLLLMACPGSNNDPTPQTQPKSNAGNITEFAVDSVDFVIDESKQTITAVYLVVGDIDLQHLNLKPVITLSGKATVSPASGVSQDFLNPVSYVVTAEDGTQKTYTAQVATYAISGSTKVSLNKSGSTGSTPTKLSFTYLVPSLTSAFAGTWKFDYSGALEVRQVGSDQVLTLQEQTPTTQTVTVQVNGVNQAPTTSSGKFGNSFTLATNKTYTGQDDQGDTSSGTWSWVDLGKSEPNRYQLRLDGVTNIPGGPSAAGVTNYYVVALNAKEMYLTRDPIVTSKSTTTFNMKYKK